MAMPDEQKNPLIYQILGETAADPDLNFQANPTRALATVISRSLDVGWDAFADSWGVVDPPQNRDSNN